MNFLLVAVVASLGVALVSGNACTSWVTGGKTAKCSDICSGSGGAYSQAVTSSSSYKVCAVNEQNKGLRVGYQKDGSNSNKCVVGYEGNEVAATASDKQCLCTQPSSSCSAWASGSASATCSSICSGSGTTYTDPLATGTPHPLYGVYHVCSVDQGGAGQRPGFQQDSYGNSNCVVGYNGNEVLSSLSKKCLCHSGVVYDGCYPDDQQPNRLFPRTLSSSYGGNPSVCLAECESEGYGKAGLIGSDCHCGFQTDADTVNPVSSGQCSTSCSGNSNFFCGGNNRISVYSHDPDSPPPPLGPVPPQGHKGVDYIGCYADNVQRFFPANLGPGPAGAPIDCVNACENIGFKYAGLDNSDCWCGGDNELVNVAPRPLEECWWRCNGDNEFLCGNHWRLSVYKRDNGGYGNPWAGEW